MKLVLDNELIAEEFFEDTYLFGIMAPLPAHRFVWTVNRGLRFNFQLMNDLEIGINRKNRSYYYQVYEYAEPFRSLRYYLYNNLHDGEYLLPEFRHLDYLCLIKGDLPEPDAQHLLMQDLRKMEGVQMVVELTNEKIKNKQYLIF
jgi:hypothetical protein